MDKLDEDIIKRYTSTLFNFKKIPQNSFNQQYNSFQKWNSNTKDNIFINFSSTTNMYIDSIY